MLASLRLLLRYAVNAAAAENDFPSRYTYNLPLWKESGQLTMCALIMLIIEQRRDNCSISNIKIYI